MMPEAIMVFAAGLGTRMGALTQDRPKPLIEVGGRTLIDHALGLTEGLKVVVNVHYRAGQLREYLAGRAVIADETAALLETGGGLRAALPLLDADPVFTLNCDAVWRGPNPLKVLTDHWREGMEALLLLIPRERAIGHRGAGDFVALPSGRLNRGRGLVYSGAQILHTGTLDTVPEAAFSLNRVWDGMIARGTLFGIEYDGQWCDVGRPESIALAEGLLR